MTGNSRHRSRDVVRRNAGGPRACRLGAVAAASVVDAGFFKIAGHGIPARTASSRFRRH